MKIPDVGAAVQIASVSGSADEDDAQAWVKADNAASFAEPFRLGDAVGNPLYTNTALSVAPDGTFTYAYIGSDNGGAITVRRRTTNGAFSGEVQAVPRGRFRAYVEVAANTTGTVVVAWSESGRFRYRYSTNFGASYSSTANVADVESLNAPNMVVTADNRIWITFGSSGGDIYAGLWNGTGFTLEQVTSGGSYEADPTITVNPTGTPFVAWRRVDGGFYYAGRQANGTWPASRLINMNLIGPAAISADEAGNLSFAWTSDAAGSADLYVAYATAANAFEGPLRLAQSGDSYFIPHVASNINGQSLIHVAVERHGGSGLRTDYVLLAASGAGTMGATPVIESSAPLSKGATKLVGNKQSVVVGFTNVTGTPNQIRWRWGLAPSDTASDSGGWVTFTNPITVPLSTTVLTSDCLPETLYTQVRSATTTETTAKQASILVDNQVVSFIRAVNPHIGNKSALFTGPFDLNSDGGASDGDPNYTRKPVFYLEINAANECGGLAQFQVGASPDSVGTATAIANDFYANTVALPNASTITDGPSPVAVRLSDKIGNSIAYTNTLIYDTIKPVLSDTAALTITSNPVTTILADLKFSGIQVTDAYPGGYWGVWVANSLTEVTDPLSSTTLLWTPVRISDRSANPVVKDWSLATRLPVAAEDLQPNTKFYVYVRFLDGAGNPTDRVVPQTITLEKITLPGQYMPFIRR